MSIDYAQIDKDTICTNVKPAHTLHEQDHEKGNMLMLLMV